MLSRWFSHRVRIYVEKQIKSALMAGQFTHGKENNLKELMSWLAVASGGVYKPEYLNYTFLNGQSLFDYAIETSNQALAHYKNAPLTFFERLLPALYRARRRTRQYLMPAQSVIVNVLKASHPLQKQNVSTLGYWKRFLSRRLRPPIGILAPDQGLYFKVFLQMLHSKYKPLTTLPPSSSLMEEQKQAPLIKRPEANFPSTGKKALHKEAPLREEYTPDELINQPEILGRRMESLYTASTSTPLTAIKAPLVAESRGTVPKHLQPWLTSPLSLIQEININQTQQQQRVDTRLQRREQKQQIDCESMFARESATYIDSSQKHALHETEKTDSLLGAMVKRSLHEKYPGKKIALSISTEAEKNLEKYDTYRDWRLKINPEIGQTGFYSDLPFNAERNYFTLNNLPRGIFIDEEESKEKDTIHVSLCFSEAYRNEQRQNKDHVLFLDPLTKTKPPHKWYESPFYLLSDQISGSKMPFRDGHLQFFENMTYPGLRLHSTLGMIMAEKRYPSEAVFLDFIDRLINLQNRKILIHQHQETPTSHKALLHEGPFTNLLMLYYEHCMQRDVSLELSASLNQILETLPTLEEEQLKFLYLLSLENPKLEETWEVFNYFTDFFKERGLPITKEFIEHLHERYATKPEELFLSLNLILDCLSLSLLPDFQARLLGELPEALGPATDLLRNGYSFVHQSMRLEALSYSATHQNWKLEVRDFSPEKTDKILKMSYEASKKNYPGASSVHASMCRAHYLHYLAASVAPEYVENAFQKWEKETGQSLSADTIEALDALDKILTEKWPVLQAHLLSLPTRLNAPPQRPENVFINKRKQKENKITYLEKDIDVLFSKLKLETQLETQLRGIVKAVNDKEEQYSSYTPQELQAQCEGFREKRESKEQKSTEALLDNLCLLRELYYRSSYHRSQETPKVGKWLRLEQLVAILLASSGQQGRLLENETSEGKTLIVAFTAILHALQGEKVDVLTHNESMAKEAAAHVHALFQCLNLTVANEKSSVANIQTADIYFVDASTAVINDLLAQTAPNEEKQNFSGARQASVALIDEVDNIAIDIHANTTMQISAGEEAKKDEAHKKEMEEFIQELNGIVRHALAKEDKLTSEARQIEFVKSKLGSIPDSIDLPYWIKAAIAAFSLKKDEDYVVDEDQVRIVHKKTTGRIDYKSQWGNGVHHCVAVWEKLSNDRVKMPGFSKVIAEGDVESYLKKYKKRCGFTGTLGAGPVVKAMQEVTGIEAEPVIVPRAKRPAPSGANWPIPPHMKEKKNENRNEGDYDQLPKIYNRSYSFKDIFIEDRESHEEKLLDLLKRAKKKEFSTLVHFTTIEECQNFALLLKENSFENIQILDDKREEETKGTDKPCFRPPEAAVIERAKKPGMITLTTAAGGRAIDYKSVNMSIQARPALKRVETQQKSRVGRNGEFGIVYEIYCIDDLDEIAQKQWRQASEKGPADEKEDGLENAPLQITSQRVILDEMQERMQKVDLDTITARRPLRLLKSKMQEEYTDLLAKEQKDPAALQQQWCSLFSSIGQEANADLIEEKWAAFKEKAVWRKKDFS